MSDSYFLTIFLNVPTEIENAHHLVLLGSEIKSIKMKKNEWEINSVKTISYSSVKDSLDLVYYVEGDTDIEIQISATGTGWVRAFNITVHGYTDNLTKPTVNLKLQFEGNVAAVKFKSPLSVNNYCGTVTLNIEKVNEPTTLEIFEDLQQKEINYENSLYGGGILAIIFLILGIIAVGAETFLFYRPQFDYRKKGNRIPHDIYEQAETTIE